MEGLEAQVAILWFGDSVGTKTLQGGSAVQIFSHGAFRWRQMEPEFGGAALAAFVLFRISLKKPKKRIRVQPQAKSKSAISRFGTKLKVVRCI